MGTGLRRIDPTTRAVVTLDFEWGVILGFYDASDDLEYLGFHRNQDALTSDDEWVVYKFTYTATGGFEGRQKIDGVLDDRATLAWR